MVSTVKCKVKLQAPAIYFFCSTFVTGRMLWCFARHVAGEAVLSFDELDVIIPYIISQSPKHGTESRQERHKELAAV